MNVRWLYPLLSCRRSDCGGAALFSSALKQPGAGATFNYTGLNGLLLGWIGDFGQTGVDSAWSANVLFSIAGFRTLPRQPGRFSAGVEPGGGSAGAGYVGERTIETDESATKFPLLPVLALLVLASMVALAGPS